MTKRALWSVGILLAIFAVSPRAYSQNKIESWYTDNVLYDQRFVNTEKYDGTVGDMVGALASKMGENISVRRTARVAIAG